MFLNIFSDDLLDIITTQTNIYANQYKRLNPPATSEEIKAVINIFILSDYCRVPYREMYWSTSTLITYQFQKQFQETILGRSLLIFTFEITLILTMIVITRLDPYLTFWIRISKGLCLRITSVSMTAWYHIMVDMVPSSLLEESPYDFGLKFVVFMLVKWGPSSCRTMLWKRYWFARNRIRTRFRCCPCNDWEIWSNQRVYSGNGHLFHYITTSR